MARALAAIVAGLTIAAPASAAVEIVAPFPLDRYAGTGAVGLAVPGAGPTVTRESALNTLLTGEVQSSLLGGTPASDPLIEIGEGPPPDTLVVLPPPGRSENDRYPIAVTPGPRGLLTSDSTRIEGLVSLADVARGRLEVVASDDPVAALERLQERIERNDRIRLPLSVLVGGIAYLTALFAPRLAPRVILLALSANLWLAGWWAVALVGLAAARAAARARLRCDPRRLSRSRSASTRRRSRSRRSGPPRRGGSTASRTCSRRSCSSRPSSARPSSDASGSPSPRSRSSRSRATGSARTAAACSSSSPPM